MKQILKLISTDNCNTNAEMLIQVEGKQELTDEILQRTKDMIERYKKEHNGESNIDNIVNVACEHLESEGYMCDYVSADVTVEF